MKTLAVLALCSVSVSLVACAPALSDATLRISPGSVQLGQGQSTPVTAWFQKFVYEGEQSEGYNVNVYAPNNGLRVLVMNPVLKATDAAMLKVTAAKNADLGRQVVLVTVSDKRGHQVQARLNVLVVP